MCLSDEMCEGGFRMFRPPSFFAHPILSSEDFFPSSERESEGGEGKNPCRKKALQSRDSSGDEGRDGEGG